MSGTARRGGRPGGGAPARGGGRPARRGRGRGRGRGAGRRAATPPLTRFANSEIHQNVASTEVLVNLRFVQGRRVGVASTGRADAEGLRSLVERAAAITANVEELEDWAGLPRGRPLPPPIPAAWSDATAAASPELRAEGARAVIAAADEAGVTAFGSFSTDAEAVAVATSTGIRAAERRTSSQLLTVTMGPDNGTGLRGAGRGRRDRRSTPTRSATRPPTGRRLSAKPRRHRARRLPGRAPPLRGRRPRGHARLPRVLGAGGPGGPLVLGGRQAGRLAAGHASPTTARDPAGLPGRASTPRACPSSGSRCSTRASAATSRSTPRPRPAPAAPRRGHGLPAPNPYGPFPTNMVMAGGDASLGRAGRRPRPRPARDPVPLHEPGPLQEGDHHGHDPRRHVPRRGRPRSWARCATCGSRCPTSTRWPTSRRSAASGAASAGSSARRVVPSVRLSSFSFTGATAAE